MKKILLILSFALSLTNCKAQQQNTKLMIPEIDNTFEIFDIETFNKESIRGRRIVKTKDYYIDELTQSFGYAKTNYPTNSYFNVVKLFNKDGQIKDKLIQFNNGSQCGMWYKYNEKGKLIEEINTSQGYNFSWEQIIKYCEDNKIVLTKGYDDSGFHTSIYKEEENGKKIWIITYQLPVGDKLMEITLDGKTGKEIKRRELDFIGG